VEDLSLQSAVVRHFGNYNRSSDVLHSFEIFFFVFPDLTLYCSIPFFFSLIHFTLSCDSVHNRTPTAKRPGELGCGWQSVRGRAIGRHLRSPCSKRESATARQTSATSDGPAPHHTKHCDGSRVATSCSSGIH